MMPHRHFAVIFAFACIGACDAQSTTPLPDASNVCGPGAVVPCVGDNNCVGEQVCNASGTDFSACDCDDMDAATDAITQSDASGDGSTWTPAMLSGLVLWLDDTTGVNLDNTGHVEAWIDRSFFGNDALQSTSQNRPLWSDGVINGHGAAVTSSGYLTIGDAPSLHFGTTPFAIIVVGALTAGSGTSTVWNKVQMTSGINIYINNNGTTQDLIATTATATVKATNVSEEFHFIMLTGPQLTLSVDAHTLTGTTATDDVSAPNAPITLGQANGGGEIAYAEIIAVAGTISSQDQMSLLQYAANKFGL